MLQPSTHDLIQFIKKRKDACCSETGKVSTSCLFIPLIYSLQPSVLTEGILITKCVVEGILKICFLLYFFIKEKTGVQWMCFYISVAWSPAIFFY